MHGQKDVIDALDEGRAAGAGEGDGGRRAGDARSGPTTSARTAGPRTRWPRWISRRGSWRVGSASVDVAIVGGGAAGLTTAIMTARRLPGARVVVFDGASRLGAKILVSGGGRCNVTNRQVVAADFWGGERRFIDSVLRAFSAADTVTFFEGLGVGLHEEEHGKLFPDSGRSRTRPRRARRSGAPESASTSGLGRRVEAVRRADERRLRASPGGLVRGRPARGAGRRRPVAAEERERWRRPCAGGGARAPHRADDAGPCAAGAGRRVPSFARGCVARGGAVGHRRRPAAGPAPWLAAVDALRRERARSRSTPRVTGIAPRSRAAG